MHRVFHGIRFKVNNEDWLSVMDSLFLSYNFFFFLEKSLFCNFVEVFLSFCDFIFYISVLLFYFCDE